MSNNEPRELLTNLPIPISLAHEIDSAVSEYHQRNGVRPSRQSLGWLLIRRALAAELQYQNPQVPTAQK